MGLGVRAQGLRCGDAEKETKGYENVKMEYAQTNYSSFEPYKRTPIFIWSP